MTTADSALFVDTNILVYTTDTLSSWHELAKNRLQAARHRGDHLVISPQILREYIATATRSVIGAPAPMSQILANVADFRRTFALVEETDAVMTELVALLGQVAVAGKQVHDTNIVATMLAHGIRRLLTNNETHFNRFSAWITVVPLTQPR